VEKDADCFKSAMERLAKNAEKRPQYTVNVEDGDIQTILDSVHKLHQDENIEKERSSWASSPRTRR